MTVPKYLIILAAAVLLIFFAIPAQAQQLQEDHLYDQPLGFKLVGPKNKIRVSSFTDPKIPNAVCYLSRFIQGGISGGLGLATDPSNASIACRQVGPITVPADLPANEEIFSEDRNVFFKQLLVTRIWDKEKNVLVYLTFSKKLVDGSPKNSVSVIPVTDWN